VVLARERKYAYHHRHHHQFKENEWNDVKPKETRESYCDRIYGSQFLTLTPS
jgi:hypothetical protein